jgi:hypothetical protein
MRFEIVDQPVSLAVSHPSVNTITTRRPVSDRRSVTA